MRERATTTRALSRTLLLWLAGLVLLTACSETPNPDVLRFGLAGAPANFDPRFATDAASDRLNRLLYARLVEVDDRAQPIAGLATWTQPSAIHYRFTLDPDRQPFHHGLPPTSEDVKATFDFIRNPDNGSPHASTLRMIARIETPTPEIVDFFLHAPDSLFPSYLIIGILPANLMRQQHPFHTAPVGSGPFQWGAQLNETHWRLIRLDDAQPVDFLRIPDPTVRTLKLLAGEIDIMQNDLPPELVSYLEHQPGIDIQQRRGANFSYLGFNLQDPVVGRTKVRQAIAHAIDRPAIIRYALGDMARPANALFPPDHWAGADTLEGYAHDPARARQLLRDEGFHAEHPARIHYKTSTDPFRLRLAAIVQHQLEQVGIRVSIHSHDWGTFYGDIKAGRFQMYSLSWVGLTTPDMFRYAFHSEAVPPAGANRGRYRDPIADTLIEQAQSEHKMHQKQELYHRLQAHLLRTLPYVPLWFEDHVALTRRGVEGYDISPAGHYDGLRDTTRRPAVLASIH